MYSEAFVVYRFMQQKQQHYLFIAFQKYYVEKKELISL